MTAEDFIPTKKRFNREEVITLLDAYHLINSNKINNTSPLSKLACYVNNLFKVNIAERKRNREYSDAKKIYCFIAYEKGLSNNYSAIGREINVDHATVIYNIKEAKVLMNNKEFSIKLNKALNVYEKSKSV